MEETLKQKLLIDSDTQLVSIQLTSRSVPLSSTLEHLHISLFPVSKSWETFGSDWMMSDDLGVVDAIADQKGNSCCIQVSCDLLLAAAMSTPMQTSFPIDTQKFLRLFFLANISKYFPPGTSCSASS